MRRRLSFALLLTACFTLSMAADASAAPELTQLAQAQPAPAPAPTTQAPAAPAPAAPAGDSQQTAAEPIGNVATLTGSATVTRNNATTPLQLRDDIFANDVVETAAKSKLGITFNDATTFNLSASAKIVIDSYVYQEGGKENGALFDVARGTVAFVAASVAKTGDMRISTPTATLGIRGTTGLIEVPEGAAATSRNVAIKLYPDADGKVGRIEINDRSGARLGALTQGASGFAIRPGMGGARFAAVPLTLSPQQVARDQGFVRQVHTAQNLGRQMVDEQRTFRRANPGQPYPNRGQPVQPRPQQPNAVPGQNRTAPQQQQPGQPNRPGQPGQQNRPGQPQQPGTPNRQGSTGPTSTQPAPGSQQPGQNAATPRTNSLPGQPGGAPLPPSGQQQGAQPPAGQQPGARQPNATPPNGPQQNLQRQGVQQPGIQRPSTQPPGVQQPGVHPPAAAQPVAPQPGMPQQAQPHPLGAAPGVPGLQRPGLQNRPALPARRLPPPPKGGKPPKEKRR